MICDAKIWTVLETAGTAAAGMSLRIEAATLLSGHSAVRRHVVANLARDSLARPSPRVAQSSGRVASQKMGESSYDARSAAGGTPAATTAEVIAPPERPVILETPGTSSPASMSPWATPA